MLVARLFPLFVFLMCVYAGQGHADANIINVGVSSENLKRIQSNIPLDENRIAVTDCPALDDETVKGSGRSYVEFLVLCLSMQQANENLSLQLREVSSHARLLHFVARGILDVSSASIFQEGMENLGGELLVLSDPVIPKGEFEKFIVTHQSRSDVLSVTSLAELQQFSGLSVQSWKVDMRTLEEMSVKKVITTPQFSLMDKMLKGLRADFTIMEAHFKDQTGWENEFEAIPGIKVALVSSRHFPVSPLRNDIVKALNQYLRILRHEKPKMLKDAFVRSGFITKKLRDSRLIFPVIP